jgi:hypothetical protein
MDDRPPPDALEKGIRFGCGFSFGGVILFFALARHFFNTASPFWISVGLGALVCGLLAIRYGDSFYHGILAFFRWWL